MPPITLLTDMVSPCRLLAAHGARSCLSVRTQPLMATGAWYGMIWYGMVWYGMVDVCDGICDGYLAAAAPSQTSTIPYYTYRWTMARFH